MERKLKSGSPDDLKSMLDVLRANAGLLVERWAHATSQSSYIKVKDFDMPDEARIDRLRTFIEALLERAENPASKEAHESLKSEIRAEHARSLSLSIMVKKQNLLRDLMVKLVEEEMPDFPKVQAKTTIDAIVDKSVEGIVIMLEDFSEMKLSLSRCNEKATDPGFSVDQAMSKFCRNALEYFDVDFVALFRFDGNSNELVCRACAAKGLTLTKDSRLHLDSCPTAEEAFKKGGPVVVGDGIPEPGHRMKVMGQIAFARSTTVPLMADSKPIGALIVGDNSRAIAMTQDEVSLLEDLGEQVVCVLQSTDAFELMNLRTRAQKGLIQTAASLQQEIESEEIYRIVGTRLGEIVPSDELAFYAFDWSRRQCSPVYATGPYAGEIMADKAFPADIGIVGYVAKSRKAEVILDSETDPRGNYIPGTPLTHTRMLVVPVIGQKEVIGVIELFRYPPDVFSEEDLEIATLFANHASVAIENARLLKEVLGVRDQVELAMDLLTHDIANHTTPMIAYIESLQNKSDLDKDVSVVLDRMVSHIDSMNRLVDMVRTLTRLRQPGPKVMKPMDLSAAINSSLKEVRSLEAELALGIKVSLPTYEMNVLADDMLKELFVNLLLGSVLSERWGSTKLTITAEPRMEPKMEYWWVKVTNHDRFIPDNLKSEVLKMAKSSKSELSGGFGIGLAVAKAVVDRYSGSMWVSDIVPGDHNKGSVFNILLPKAK